MPNTAPLDAPSAVALSIYEDDTNPPDLPVQWLVPYVSDPDGDPVGIAITQVGVRIGTWQYSLDGGASWLSIDANLINSTTNEVALLLGPEARVRVLPFANQLSYLDSSMSLLRVRSWDGTSGEQGQYVVINEVGGTTAFSWYDNLADIYVYPTNDTPTFSAGSGIASIDFAMARSVLVQPDGSIIVVGYVVGSSVDIAVTRLNPDGSVDPTFNGGLGVAVLPLGNGTEEAVSVVRQPDGKLLLGGYSGSGDYDFIVVRLNADGSPDTAFGTQSVATVAMGSDYDLGRSIALQPDGRILITGLAAGIGGFQAGVVRLNVDGSLDTTFNGTGKLLVPGSSPMAPHTGVAVQADGKVVMAWTTWNGTDPDFAVMRFNADGSADTSFSGDGLADIVAPGAEALFAGLAVQQDGKILLAGSTQTGMEKHLTVLRLNADGTLDTAFNGTGQVVIPVGTGSSLVYAMALQPDGKILVAGGAVGSAVDYAVVRLNTDGSLDTSFNQTGKVLVPVRTGNDAAYALSVQPDGKILLLGDGPGNTGMAVVRLNADGSVDTTFDSQVADTLGGSVSYTEGATAITLDSSVAIYDVELAGIDNYAGASLTLARHGGADADDQFSGIGGLSFSGSNAIVSGVTIGTVSNGGGTLTITFNGNATQSRVNQALSSIGYANLSDAPPASLRIDWLFSDGNSYLQGDGGALSTSGSTTVNITAVNDSPTGLVSIDGTLLTGGTVTANAALSDADGLGTLAYRWYADDVAIGGATGQSYTLTAAEAGKRISVVVSYIDGGGTLESVTGVAGTVVGTSIVGGPGRDRLLGTAGNDTLDGRGDEDNMAGGAGDDRYLVDTTGDVVVERAGEGSDTVIASLSYKLAAHVENLTLVGPAPLAGWGNAQANVLVGNAAANLLTGQGGADTYTGGLGGDIFSFAQEALGATQTITDFSAPQGDWIDLRLIDANEAIAGDQAFRFIGEAAFSANAAGLLRFDAATNSLLGSTDADAQAELVIVLVGITHLGRDAGGIGAGNFFS